MLLCVRTGKSYSQAKKKKKALSHPCPEVREIKHQPPKYTERNGISISAVI